MPAKGIALLAMVLVDPHFYALCAVWPERGHFGVVGRWEGWREGRREQMEGRSAGGATQGDG